MRFLPLSRASQTASTLTIKTTNNILKPKHSHHYSNTFQYCKGKIINMELNLKIILFLPLIYYLGFWADSYYAWEITFIISYCLFLLAKKKRLSIWSFLIIGFGTFILRIGIYYFYVCHYSYMYHFHEEFLAEALTETPYCLLKFLLIWGTLFIVRKILNKSDYFMKRRELKAVIYLAVLTFFFYFHFAYEYLHISDKPYFYQKIYDFWLSVIPEFMLDV